MQCVVDTITFTYCSLHTLEIMPNSAHVSGLHCLFVCGRQTLVNVCCMSIVDYAYTFAPPLGPAVYALLVLLHSSLLPSYWLIIVLNNSWVFPAIRAICVCMANHCCTTRWKIIHYIFSVFVAVRFVGGFKYDDTFLVIIRSSFYNRQLTNCALFIYTMDAVNSFYLYNAPMSIL